MPGDAVRFKCGHTWRETLNIRSSGTASQPLVFGTYGDCSTSKPEIRGSVLVTGWTKYSGNIYAASLRGTPEVRQLFVDGKLMRLAKHPNNGYWIINKDSAAAGSCSAVKASYDPFALVGTCVIDQLLKSDYTEFRNADLIGGGIHIKTNEFWIDSSTVAGYGTNGAVTLVQRTRYLPKLGNNYYFNNKLWMLDQPGEWFYDKVQERIYVWLPDNSHPSSHTIDASVRNYGIYADEKKVSTYVILRGLMINQVSADGIHLEGAANIFIDNVEILNSRSAGILLARSNNAVIQSSKISNSGREGIVLRQSANSTIAGNFVNESGTPGFYLGAPDTSFGAIATDSSSVANITKNTITNAGYIGIRLQSGSSVSNNTINNSCLVLTDCGAIYVNGTGISTSSPPSMISENTINTTGTPLLNGLAAGIYLDDFANHVTVFNNKISNSERGIFLHLAHDNSIIENIVTGSRNYSLSISENISSSYAGITRNNNIIRNSFSQANGKEIINLRGEYGNINFATFSENSYSSTQKDNVIVQTQHKPNYPSINENTSRYTLTSWQTIAKQDFSSTFSGALPSSPKAFNVEMSN